MFQDIFKQSERSLVAQLREELARRAADSGEEPSLPEPKKDGLFADLGPIPGVGPIAIVG